MSSFISSDTLFAPKGATVSYFDGNGELAFETPLPFGRVDAAGYVVPDHEGRVSKGVVVVGKPSGYGIIESDLKHETGANPDFSPTSATWQEERQRLLLQQMIDERFAKTQIPSVAPQPEPVQVIEPTTPAPDEQSEVS